MCTFHEIHHKKELGSLHNENRRDKASSVEPLGRNKACLEAVKQNAALKPSWISRVVQEKKLFFQFRRHRKTVPRPKFGFGSLRKEDRLTCVRTETYNINSGASKRIRVKVNWSP
jgi:hypothetical protein